MNALSLSIVLCRLAKDFGLRMGIEPERPGWRHMIGASGHALCGHGGNMTTGSLSLWGVETAAQEHWCLQCAAEAMELLAQR